METNEARHFAMGYAHGRADANDIHGEGCCCQNCPWNGDHGWPKFVIPGGIVAFAQAYSALHDAFEHHNGAAPPTIGQAFSTWQDTGGQRAGVLPQQLLSKACRRGLCNLCEGVSVLPDGSTLPCDHWHHKQGQGGVKTCRDGAPGAAG